MQLGWPTQPHRSNPRGCLVQANPAWTGHRPVLVLPGLSLPCGPRFEFCLVSLGRTMFHRSYTRFCTLVLGAFAAVALSPAASLQTFKALHTFGGSGDGPRSFHFL